MIACSRTHPFWDVLLKEIERATEDSFWITRHFEIMYTTGPGLLTRAYHIYRFRYRLQFLPHELFHPLSLAKKELTATEREQAYAIHYGMGMWEGFDSQVLVDLWAHYGIILLCIGLFLFPQLFWARKQKTD
jgi:hypothetical protein